MRTHHLMPGSWEPAIHTVEPLSSYSDKDITGFELFIELSYGCFSAKGSSKREPGDKDNSEIAELLAASRCLQNLASGLQRRAEGLIKHAADMEAYKLEQKSKKQMLVFNQEEKRKFLDSPLARISKPRRNRSRLANSSTDMLS